jgi:hypothetical protein
MPRTTVFQSRPSRKWFRTGKSSKLRRLCSWSHWDHSSGIDFSAGFFVKVGFIEIANYIEKIGVVSKQDTSHGIRNRRHREELTGIQNCLVYSVFRHTIMIFVFSLTKS